MRTKRFKNESFNRVVSNINKALERIENRSAKGLTRAANYIMIDTEITPPLNPMETGNLIDSRFVVNSDGEVVWGKSPLFIEAKNRNPAKMYSDHYTILSEAQLAALSSPRHSVIFGYTAYYAVLVHEMEPGASGTINWSRPSSGTKFFESSIRRNKDEILRIIAKEARGE